VIALRRPKHVPKLLATKGKALADTAHALFSGDPAGFSAGTKTIPFDSTVYGSKAVKRRLLRLQADKCCFCESKISHNAYGDVEHFRPKAAWKQSGKNRLSRPGYYWLAYEWRNLLLCCQLCNQRHKGNLFPLRDPGTRAKSPSDTLAKEEPMFINPSTENPEAFIGFRGDTPYPINNDPRARLTIARLGLKRKPLRERRLDRLEIAKMIYQIASGIIPTSVPHRNEARALLASLSSPASEYSAALKCAVTDGFAFV